MISIARQQKTANYQSVTNYLNAAKDYPGVMTFANLTVKLPVREPKFLFFAPARQPCLSAWQQTKTTTG
jgi:hypothetical protein